MAYIVDNNQPASKMLSDLNTLMLANGWSKIDNDNVTAISSSQGFVWLGKANAVPGKYSDTTGVQFSTGNMLRSEGHSSQGDTTGSFFSQFPTEFSISFWAKGFSDIQTTNGGSNGTIGFSGAAILPLFSPFYHEVEKRHGIYLTCARQLGIGGNYPVCSFFEGVESAFVDKSGHSYELFTFTYSNLTKELEVYVNGVYMGKESTSATSSFSALYNYTLYPAFYGLGCHDITIDQLVIWGKVLNSAEILALSIKSTKVLSTDSYVFDIVTENINNSPLGFYTSKASNGSTITVGIQYEYSTNNLSLINPFFKADSTKYTRKHNKRLSCYIETQLDKDYPKLNAETETTFYPYYSTDYTYYNSGKSYILPFIPDNELISKYWLVVDKDRIVISYKLHNISAARSTPLYCLGYIGKLESIGNDSGQVFSAGMTTNTSYNWTTVSTTLRSGVNYTDNCMVRGSSYTYPTLTSNFSTTVGFINLSGTSFVAPILVQGTNIVHGSVRGVYLVPKQGANPEDIITIGTIDYVVLEDGDNSTANYNLLLKLE